MKQGRGSPSCDGPGDPAHWKVVCCQKSVTVSHPPIGARLAPNRPHLCQGQGFESASRGQDAELTYLPCVAVSPMPLTS